MNPEEPQVDSPQIYCPYTNLQAGTTVALANYTVNFVNCTGDKWAYTKYFQDRWDEGKTFISVEHDIVFWPGAIEELLRANRIGATSAISGGARDCRSTTAGLASPRSVPPCHVIDPG